jgi:hypothetical protein
MDYSKSIKAALESADFAHILQHFKLESNGEAGIYLCTNASYAFAYVEPSAVFLAVGLDKLCKSQASSLIDSTQVSVACKPE